MIDNPPQKELSDRVKTLESKSGLKVKFTAVATNGAKKNVQNLNYYEFFHEGQVVVSFFSYPKALAYAEGVAMGRKLS